MTVMRAVGKKIVIRKLERFHERMMGPIIIPEKADLAIKGNSAEITSLTDEVAESTGLKVGDKVIYDALSVFDDTKEYAVTNSENIIVRVNEDGSVDSVGDTVLTCQIISPATRGGIEIPNRYVKEDKFHVLKHGLKFTYKSDVVVGCLVTKKPDSLDCITFTYSPHNKIYTIIDRKILMSIIEEEGQ